MVESLEEKSTGSCLYTYAFPVYVVCVLSIPIVT